MFLKCKKICGNLKTLKALLILGLPTLFLVLYSRRRYHELQLYHGENPKFETGHAQQTVHTISRKNNHMPPASETYVNDLSRTDNFTVEPIYNTTQFTKFDKDICDHQICNVYFIKVHKTGSTTLQNILYRFGFRRKLLFALFECGNGMPFPNAAHSKYMIEDIAHGHYNIVSEHALFLPEAFQNYMPPDTRVISLLRHPLKNLKSTLSFHGLLSRMGFKSDKGDFLEGFLKNPKLSDSNAKFSGSSTECGPFTAPSYTKNAMSYHFGLINQNEQDPAKLWKFIKELDKNISMVLILETFDESLIMMKRQLNWTTEDIIYLPLWSLKFHGKPDLKLDMEDNKTRNMVVKHKQWSPGDYILYKHFTQKMHNILSQQNKDFWDEIKVFKVLLSKVKIFCTSMCSLDIFSTKASFARSQLFEEHFVFAETKWSKEIVLTYIDCITMMLATLDYQEALKVIQIPGYCDNTHRKRQTRGKYCTLKDQLVYTFPWSIIRSKILGSKITCLKYFQTG